MRLHDTRQLQNQPLWNRVLIAVHPGDDWLPLHRMHVAAGVNRWKTLHLRITDTAAVLLQRKHAGITNAWLCTLRR